MKKNRTDLCGFLLLVPLLASCSAILTALPPEDDADAGDGGDLEGDGEGGGCGNSFVDDGEECDDGNTDDADGCKQDCTFTCHDDGECRDEDSCNGVETCDTGTHRCESGQAQPDGFVCGYAPRYICRSGECLQSSCGDGFVDTGAGESCDPPAEKCSENCNLICLGNEDCPDDGNTCNGEEYCEMTAQECSHRSPPPDGTECSEEPRQICVSGSCQESTCGDLVVDSVGLEECDDGNLDDVDGCTRACVYTCHDSGECDDDVACTDDICITALHVCYFPTSPSGTICRPIAGDCDVEDACDGISVECPADAFRDEAVLCRSAAGACDVADYCSGLIADCPADAKHGGSVVCRGVADVCDSPESCDGIGNDCPVDVFLGGTTECRASTRPCDPAEFCPGDSAACPDDVNCGCNGDPDCPDDGNICNGTEHCGPTAECEHENPPSDGYVCVDTPRQICLGGECKESVCGDGFVDAGASEECDDANAVPGDGCEEDCTFSCHGNLECFDGHPCTQDLCNPGTHACQNPIVSGGVCRAIAGDCDLPESCDGASPDCPENKFKADGTLCRPSGSDVLCDPAETCTGASPECPPDYWRCWEGVDGGGTHTCGIKTNSDLFCWGNNTVGQLGLGDASATTEPRPKRVPFDDTGSGMRWEQVSAGGAHTCAIANGGCLYCWGNNGSGQLGDGSFTRRYSPTRVGSETDWRMVSAGTAHTCGVLGSDIYCWGSNSDGQIGIGSLASHFNSPQQVEIGGAARLVACGGGHACGLVEGGALFCWGRNSSGQLGNGTFTSSNRPVPVGETAIGWDMTALGENHTCGISVAAGLYCWGNNEHHQVGDGTTSNRNLPVLIDLSLIGPMIIPAGTTGGGLHTCAFGTTSLFCWGGNTFGQVGDGTNSEKPSPTRVGGTDWGGEASAGTSHSCAIKASLDLYCWGLNNYGQVGDGTTTNRSLPVWIDAPVSDPY